MQFGTLALINCIASWSGAYASDAISNGKTVLFLTNSERGLANVVLATAHALLVDHPEVNVHFASFSPLTTAVHDVSLSAQAQSPSANPIRYENISGLDYGSVFANKGFTLDDLVNGPGVKGFPEFTKNFEDFLVPWSGPEYVEIYHDLVEKIIRIDPDVVVLDTVLAPGLDATRELNRKHVMLSANQLKDHFAPKQPYGEMFWKLPALNSGYPYPVPWHLIPANIYLSIRLIVSAIWTPQLSEKRTYIKAQGLKNPVNILTSFRNDVPWISPSIPETEYPLILPDNVICTGPIYLEQATVQDVDPGLAAWLKQRPTILINLGSSFTYNETDAIETVNALKIILDQTDVQVLWKFNKRRPYSDDFLNPVAEYVKAGRFELRDWIKSDIAAVLRTGDVTLFIHHGGANSFYEGLANGIPTIVLPAWIDLYDYAVRSEWLGIGIWPNKNTAPAWSSDDLSAALSKVLVPSEQSRKLASRAKEVGELVMKSRGRRAAAQVIVDYANGKDVKAKNLDYLSHHKSGHDEL